MVKKKHTKEEMIVLLREAMMSMVEVTMLHTIFTVAVNNDPHTTLDGTRKIKDSLDQLSKGAADSSKALARYIDALSDWMPNN